MVGEAERVASLYDGRADTYDAGYADRLSLAQNADLRRMLLRHVYPGTRVLDLGCGTGLVADLLADIPLSYVGVDLSARMLDLAFDKHPHHKWVQGDLAFADESLALASWDFDVIVSTFAFGYTPYPYRAALAMWRLLERGGSLFLLTYGRYLPPYWLSEEDPPVSRYDADYLGGMFEASGFEEIRTRGWSYGSRFVRAESALLGSRVPSLARYTILEAIRG